MTTDKPMKTTPRVRECLRAAHMLYPLGKEQSEDILALLDDFATLEAQVAALTSLAGAAQPVVEPRDETKPPPGWTDAAEMGVPPLTAAGRCLRSDPRTMHTLAEAWQKYDAEHAAAPHPSGTEGPLPESARDVLVECRALIETLTVKRPALLNRIDQALAASPPDGTTPERDIARRLMAFMRTQRPDVVIARAAPPHLAAVTALDVAKLCDAFLDVTRPPDGMPGEPAEEAELRFTAADGEMLLRVLTCAGYYSDEMFDGPGLCDPLDDSEITDVRAMRESVRRQLRGGYATTLKLEQPWQSVIAEGGKQEEVRVADENTQPNEETPT